ncbi:MAG: hypothetical protein P8J02_06940, partial [Yoonia sp.]|nr:hypothetical protein [Yoonia sp.]
TIPLIPVSIEDEPREGSETFQIFSLDLRKLLLVKISLLDRFLACMKPASITLRPPCAGVFFRGFVGVLRSVTSSKTTQGIGLGFGLHSVVVIAGAASIFAINC